MLKNLSPEKYNGIVWGCIAGFIHASVLKSSVAIKTEILHEV